VEAQFLETDYQVQEVIGDIRPSDPPMGGFFVENSNPRFKYIDRKTGILIYIQISY